MHIDRKIQLGELYKELRIARGLKQKDVARKGLSIAQLSKFENGQTMLSADKLLIAIESIHMTFEEFGHKLNNYELPKDIILGKKISTLFLKQDIKGLEYLLTEVLQSEETDQYQRIQSFIIENAIHSLDQNYEINIEDRKVLVDYLFSIESWTWFELYVFGNKKEDYDYSNVHFGGWLNKTELLLQLSKGGFGLVWGNSEKPEDERDYYKLNCSYKLASYLSAGIPVVVPDYLSNVDFIKKNNVGFVVSSLEEADKVVQECTEEQYSEIVSNVKKVQYLINNGYFTKKLFVDSLMKLNSNEE